jgi:hypothetical protein
LVGENVCVSIPFDAEIAFISGIFFLHFYRVCQHFYFKATKFNLLIPKNIDPAAGERQLNVVQYVHGLSRTYISWWV